MDWYAYKVKRLRLDGHSQWEYVETGYHSYTEICLNYDVLKHDKPVVTPRLVRDVVRKLLPHAVWHHEPPRGDALIYKPVIFSVDTARELTFPPFSILGQQVVAKARVRTYDWSFGDGEAGTFDWPGKDYASATPCDVDNCDGYVSHGYRRLGHFTVRPTLRWSVQFRVQNGPWQPITGDMQTTGAPQVIHIVEAHSVLVDPGG